jgi:hypothetical protein
MKKTAKKAEKKKAQAKKATVCPACGYADPAIVCPGCGYDPRVGKKK